MRVAGGARAGRYVAPCIAGFLGGDHVCALFDRVQAAPDGPWLLLDIGTNTEIALVHGSDVISVSCASGPAFEGGRVSCGMRTAPGAVDAVRFDGDAVVLSTVADRTPVGICGSGVLSIVAALKQVAAVDRRGRLLVGPRWVRERLGTREVVLHEVPGDAAAAGVRGTLVCRAARREVQALARRVRHLEFASCPDFQRVYARRCVL